MEAAVNKWSYSVRQLSDSCSESPHQYCTSACLGHRAEHVHSRRSALPNTMRFIMEIMQVLLNCIARGCFASALICKLPALTCELHRQIMKRDISPSVNETARQRKANKSASVRKNAQLLVNDNELLSRASTVELAQVWCNRWKASFS